MALKKAKAESRNAAPFWIALFSAAILPLAAVAPVKAASDTPNQDLISRGHYLSNLADCSSCHTASNGAEFAGGRYMPTPFGLRDPLIFSALYIARFERICYRM
jgi:mono/diheme cytochrome c family protein